MALACCGGNFILIQACSLIKRPNRLPPLAPAILPVWPNRLRPGAPIGPRWSLAGRGARPPARWQPVTHGSFIAQFQQPQAGNHLRGCVFSPRDPRAKRLKAPLRIPPQTPTASQLTWFWVAMGNTQGSRGFTFGRLTDKQARMLFFRTPLFLPSRKRERTRQGRSP